MPSLEERIDEPYRGHLRKKPLLFQWGAIPYMSLARKYFLEIFHVSHKINIMSTAMHALLTIPVSAREFFRMCNGRANHKEFRHINPLTLGTFPSYLSSLWIWWHKSRVYESASAQVNGKLSERRSAINNGIPLSCNRLINATGRQLIKCTVCTSEDPWQN